MPRSQLTTHYGILYLELRLTKGAKSTGCQSLAPFRTRLHVENGVPSGGRRLVVMTITIHDGREPGCGRSLLVTTRPCTL